MTGVRVTGGELRGRKLRLPHPTGMRPTSDRARQAYFNIVTSRVPGARFLDLFAGTGIFSIEAVSRGADEALAIDASSRATQEIASIASAWALPVRALAATLPAALRSLASSEPFDLVYADPPYDFGGYPELARAIEHSIPLSGSAIVAIEHRSGESPFEGVALPRLRHFRSSRYGNVTIAFFDLGEPDEHR